MESSTRNLIVGIGLSWYKLQNYCSESWASSLPEDPDGIKNFEYILDGI